MLYMTLWDLLPSLNSIPWTYSQDWCRPCSVPSSEQIIICPISPHCSPVWHSPATVCLLCLCNARKSPGALLTPLSHRYIGPSTVFGSSGKLANVEQWRCVSILRSHSGGEWAARGVGAPAVAESSSGTSTAPVDCGSLEQPCVWATPPLPAACLQLRQCPHSCPHGLYVYIFNVELPTFRCLSWELSHYLHQWIAKSVSALSLFHRNPHTGAHWKAFYLTLRVFAKCFK